MSLSFDYSKVAHIPAAGNDRSKWFESDNEDGSSYTNPRSQRVEHYTNWEVLETIIWRTMAVGIGEITDKTVETFILRSEVWEAVQGGVKLSRLSIYHHVGLRTNVTTETDAAWWRALRKSVERDKPRSIAADIAKFESGE